MKPVHGRPRPFFDKTVQCRNGSFNHFLDDGPFFREKNRQDVFVRGLMSRRPTDPYPETVELVGLE